MWVVIYLCLFNVVYVVWMFVGLIFFFQAEDGIRYLVRSRGLGDVYKRQAMLKGLFQSAHLLSKSKYSFNLFFSRIRESSLSPLSLIHI